ncbi:MAG: hypothetical protein PHO56_01960 [Patescibacteria group bacterium]|nr:hypothetical protein [Patescibacteria group bacterium]
MDEELKKYLEKNVEDMAEMKKMVKSIKNHFVRAEIYQWLVIIVFILPVVVAGFYLWPMLQGLSGQYQQILTNGLGAITGSDANLLK